MGVYINMEMPTSCYDCDFAYQDQDSEHNVYWSCAAVHKSACMYERRDDCPLVPVPPHGRLIDADALRYWSDDSAMIAFDYVTRLQINAAPTIIPAEEGE